MLLPIPLEIIEVRLGLHPVLVGIRLKLAESALTTLRLCLSLRTWRDFTSVKAGFKRRSADFR